MYLLQSMFAGGLWIIPLITFLGALWSFYRGYRSSKSNSTTQTPSGTIDNTGNVPIYKTGGFLFGVILIIATVGILLLMNSEK